MEKPTAPDFRRPPRPCLPVAKFSRLALQLGSPRNSKPALDIRGTERRFVNHILRGTGLGDLIDAAAAILANSEKRLEIISNNISNASTSGYKREFSLSHVNPVANQVDAAKLALFTARDSATGTLKQTGNPFDLAIAGDGYFLVRDADQLHLTRSGRFARGEDGALRDSNGMILQLAGGGDAMADGNHIEVLRDGTIISDGAPLGTIGVFAPPLDSDGVERPGPMRLASVPDEVDEGRFEIRQGMLESSNVLLSDEMIALMANVRQAEGAAQLARYYDQLVGQAITTFARAGR